MASEVKKKKVKKCLCFSGIKTLLPCENAMYVQSAANISSSKKTYRECNCILCCILLQNFLLVALVH